MVGLERQRRIGLVVGRAVPRIDLVVDLEVLLQVHLEVDMAIRHTGLGVELDYTGLAADLEEHRTDLAAGLVVHHTGPAEVLAVRHKGRPEVGTANRRSLAEEVEADSILAGSLDSLVEVVLDCSLVAVRKVAVAVGSLLVVGKASLDICVSRCLGLAPHLSLVWGEIYVDLRDCWYP